MNLFVALLLTCLIMAVCVALTLLLINFNWRVFTVWNGGNVDQFYKIGTLHRHVVPVYSAPLEDKTLPILGYIGHVTFFPCDVKYIGNFAICYTGADLTNLRKVGYHWRGKCGVRRIKP